jgi:hypothetical protein
VCPVTGHLKSHDVNSLEASGGGQTLELAREESRTW